MKRRKILALALACALMLGLFCGCRDSAAEAADTGSPADPETTAAVPAPSESAQTPPEAPAEGQPPQLESQPFQEGQPPEGGFGPMGGEQGFGPGQGGFGPMEGQPEDWQIAQITGIEGNEVTLVTGTLALEGRKDGRESGFGGKGQPGGPDQQGGFGGQQGGLVMEIPGSETETGSAPEGQPGTPPEGMGQMGTPPEGMGQMGTPPEGMGQGGFPGGMESGEGHRDFAERMKEAFTPGEETLTLTVEEALISQLSTGDLVRLVTEEDGTVTGLEPLDQLFARGPRP